MEISMISADLSSSDPVLTRLSMKELGPSEARVLAAFLPKCTYVVLYTCLYPLSIAQSDIPDTLSDNRALTSLNLASNYLCGLDEDGDGTFDASGNACFIITPSSHVLACTGITALANAIPDMRALCVLNLASNNLGGWNGQYDEDSRHDTSGNTNNSITDV
jgi:hypothetical protein